MKPIRNMLALLAIVLAGLTTTQAQDPLSSWNDGPAKQSIMNFVAKVTREGSADFVPVSERIATFDNDGTLWCEQPAPVQMFFALDRVKALAPQHPEWKTKEPFASLLKGDKGALAGGEPAIAKIVIATHAGMTTDEFVPRQDAHGTVRGVHLLPGWRGRLPPRPLRHGGEGTQRMGFEALRRAPRRSAAGTMT